MRIGLDLDNTIVCYDMLFHRVALEDGLIPPDLPANKVAVRDYLRCQSREQQWRQLQGKVYGVCMDDAPMFAGVTDFLHWAARRGAIVFIVSHRTRYPAAGPAYDLHDAARNWVAHHLVAKGQPLLPEGRVFLECSKADKIQRIGVCGCNAFVDDLPEILTSPLFPATAGRFLFDPAGHHPPVPGVTAVASWDNLTQCLGEQWSTKP